MPWGLGQKDHEYYHFYGAGIGEETTGDGAGYYFYKNTYYTGDKQFLPAYGILYDIDVAMVEDEDLGEVMSCLINYKADYVERSTRRNALFYWTSVTESGEDMRTVAKILRNGDFLDDDTSGLGNSGNSETPYEAFKYIAMPVRCVK